MQDKVNTIKEKVEELSKELAASGILYLLGETLLLDIDEQAEIEYAEGDEPHSFIFKMSNGRVLTVAVTDATPAA